MSRDGHGMDIRETYSVLIAEDEEPARELLIDYILTRPELKLSGIARNGDDAFRKLSREEYDLVLMDIQLPRMTGIEVLEGLKKIPYLIFTTAHEQYAIRAFDFGAVDYLLKPFNNERFNQSIEKFLSLQNPDTCPALLTSAGFTVRERNKHYVLPYQDIMYVSSHGKNSIIHTNKEDIVAAVILKNVERRVPSDAFIRIHKQHIVNIRYVAALEYYIGGQYIVYLKDDDDSPLPVGKKYATNLKLRLNMD
jgi:DNA-binding LytR/AlgR family response regulator